MTKKNAGKAKIKSNAGKAPTKETVKTPFSECTAKDKLKCRFHGLQALHLMLPSILASGGYKGTFKAQKDETDPKSYQFFLDGNTPLPDNLVSSLKEAFAKTGWNCEFEEEGVFEGQDHVFSLTRGKPDKAEQSTEEIQEEKDKVDEVDSGVEEEIEGLADLLLEDLKASQPPQPSEETSIAILKEAFDNFMSDLLKGGLHDEAEVKAYQEILEESKKNKTSKDWQNSIIKGKELKAAHDKKKDEGVTKEDMKDFLKKYGLNDEDWWQKGGFDNVLNTWYVMLTTGKNNNTGATITTPGVKETLEEAIKLVGEDHKVSKAFKKKIAEMEEAEKQEEKAKSFRAPNGVVLTDKDFENFLAKQGTTTDKEFWKNYWKDMIKKGEAKNIDGELVKKSNLSPTLASYHGTDDPVIKALNLSSPSPTPPEAEEEDPEEDDLNSLLFDADKGKYDVNLTADDVQSFFVLPDSDSEPVKNWQTLLNTGKLLKSTVADYIKSIGGWIQEQMKIAGKDHPVTKAWEKYGLKYPEDGNTETKTPESPKTPEPPPKAPKAPANIKIDESLLKPLEHDESKFPKNLTLKKLEEAIASTGESAGGDGGLHTIIVEIDGKKYICKSGAGKKSNIIKNGYRADMAYRAGGIYAPDAKIYEFGDGKTYKLSEFIEGQRLIDVWKGADEAKREDIRKELLKGYPLDVLFSNYDVLGTNPNALQTVTITGADGKPQTTHVALDNIMIDKDGHCYRIDNDGSFFMTGRGDHKHSHGGSYTTPVDSEHWDNWDERQWIDEFRTLRRNERNLGVFDRYSTADIFLSAANIDFDKVMESLEGAASVQKGLAKPMEEMKEMAQYAKGTRLAGYPPTKSYSWTDSKGKVQTVIVDPVSSALDAIYEANKQGARPWLQKKIDWANVGWLAGHNSATYVPAVFSKPEPKEPLPPPAGTDLAKEILEGIKTINYHAKQGNSNVNQSRIDRALAVKPMVEMLKEAGYDRAVGLLEAINKIEESIKNGHGKEITFSNATGMFDVNGLSIVMGDKEKAIFDKANVEKHKEWEKEHKIWADEKAEHDKKEKAKALKAGAAPTKSFQVFEDELVKANIDTNGIKQGGGDPSINHASKSSQKGSSFNLDASKKKVRQYAMMGIPLDQMFFEDTDKVFYNGHIANGGHHVSGDDGKPNFYAAVKFYQDNPEQFRRDMESYARHKGMLALVHSNMENDAIDKETGTIFVMRGEHIEAWGKHGKGAPSFSSPTVLPPWPIDSSTSACINATGMYGGKKVGWKLPIWRITDNFMIGHGSEQEICINPIKVPYPPMYFPDITYGSPAWKKCMEIYCGAKEVKAVDKKLGKKE